MLRCGKFKYLKNKELSQSQEIHASHLLPLTAAGGVLMVRRFPAQPASASRRPTGTFANAAE